MARKNLLASVTTPLPADGTEKKGVELARSDYARRGASRSMMLSIDEMAENTRRMIEGEVIVNLDPALLDASFIGDRIDGDDGYEELRSAIQTQGQSSPILVRPSPDSDGRYMIVFGHRRARAARDLGIPVRAVVKSLENIAHIIAQGQENTARANLSFIEKALFAKKLDEMGQTKETVKAALTVDDSLLSRMLSIVETIPAEVLEALGAARGIGRDRWDDLKRLFTLPGSREAAKHLVASPELLALDTEGKYQRLVNVLEGRKKPVRKSAEPSQKLNWTPVGTPISAEAKDTGKAFTITLRKAQASEFGAYISENLEQLYRAFRDSEKFKKTGD